MKIKNISLVVAAVLLTTVACLAQQQQREPNVDRLKKDVSYLASDQLDGRRTGTDGATQAAKYIADEFSKIGLKAAVQKHLQNFPYVGSVELGKNNALTVRNNETYSLKVGEDWVPVGFSSNKKVENAQLVFAGYGIAASELNYNDYGQGYKNNEVAIVFSGTPDGDNPHSTFTRAGDIRFKVAAARNAGAGALLVIASEKNLQDDRLARLSYDNNGEAGIPVLVISRAAAAKLLEGPGVSLDDYESVADARKLPPHTPPKQPSEGASSALVQAALLRLPRAHTVTISTDVARIEVPAYNVIGVLEGSDPVLKNENIVIGAHYDHLGRGGSGSLSPTSGEIHHGADDNASGTAGLLELARVFSAQQPRPKRTLIFIAFGGEEEGLLGSAYYVNHPLTPLTNTVAMINMDMIGRMRDRKLVIGGVGTAQEWKQIIKQANSAQALQVAAHSPAPPRGVPIVVSANGRPVVTVDPNGAFELTMNEDGYGPSDHSQFYGKQIPVLFFWTGTHSDYHKPSDTFEKINYEDEARILRLVAHIIREVDGAEKRLTYQTAKADPPRGGGFRVYLGTIPNYSDSTNGLLIDGVREGSPAEKSGIKAGDRIVKIGTREVKNVYDYTSALGEMKAGLEYLFEVMRGSEKLTLKVTPEARK